MIWLFSGNTVTKLLLAAGGSALLSGPLNSPETWVFGPAAQIPEKATRLAYSQNAVRLPKQGGVVLNLRDRPTTPLSQRAHPATAYLQADAMAGNAWIIAAPSLNLVHASTGTSTESVYHIFLRSFLAGRIAPYAYAFVIPAQGLERTPDRYHSFVEAIAQQMHQWNPRTLVLSGLSAVLHGHPVPLQLLWRDVQQTLGSVNGYNLRIGRSQHRVSSEQATVRLLDQVLGKRKGGV